MITCCLISIISSKQKRDHKTMSSYGNSSVKQNLIVLIVQRSTEKTHAPCALHLKSLSIESLCLLAVDTSLHGRSTGTKSTATTTAKAGSATLKTKERTLLSVYKLFACISSKKTECTQQFTNVNKMLYLHRIKINPCIHQVKNTADLPN